MNRARIAFAGAVVFASAGSAAATATLTCAIDDATMKLELLANVGTQASSAINGLRGSPTLKPAKDRPSDTIELARENLAQQWIEEPELRLWLSVTGDATPDIDLVIVTRRATDTDFRGRYRVTVRRSGKTFKAAGRVACAFG
jgi:hypothetical protein